MIQRGTCKELTLSCSNIGGKRSVRGKLAQEQAHASAGAGNKRAGTPPLTSDRVGNDRFEIAKSGIPITPALAREILPRRRRQGWGMGQGRGKKIGYRTGKKTKFSWHGRVVSEACTKTQPRTHLRTRAVRGARSALSAGVGDFFRKINPSPRTKRTGKYKYRSFQDKGKKNFRKGKQHLTSQGTPAEGKYTHLQE